MAVIARASLMEYFKDQVEGALAHQGLSAADGTAHYVVQLLAAVVRQDGSSRAASLLDCRPLALRLAAAMDERCPSPEKALRDVADAALLLGGYFSTTATGRGVPTTYYHRLGGLAYGVLGQESLTLSPVFNDLARRFAQYAEVLGEVGQRAEMQTSAGLLRAFEAWQRSGDELTGRLLVERGVVLTRNAVRLQ